LIVSRFSLPRERPGVRSAEKVEGYSTLKALQNIAQGCRKAATLGIGSPPPPPPPPLLAAGVEGGVSRRHLDPPVNWWRRAPFAPIEFTDCRWPGDEASALGASSVALRVPCRWHSETPKPRESRVARPRSEANHEYGVPRIANRTFVGFHDGFSVNPGRPRHGKRLSGRPWKTLGPLLTCGVRNPAYSYAALGGWGGACKARTYLLYFFGFALTFAAQSSQQTRTVFPSTFTLLASSLRSQSHTGHLLVAMTASP